uniref:Uncharacterized protein n=1 Tax=Rhizophagus irregularis (strain DAOM 181602 / DAOM 197198 / MUCL 43194) TaxID=747089 RepID=U9THT9_RHIID
MKKLRVKKTVYLKDGTIFDFMIHPSNDESEVIKSSLLDISKLKVKIYNNTNSKTDQAKFKLVEELLRKASIKGFNLSYPLESSPNVFSLKQNGLYFDIRPELKITKFEIKIIEYKDKVVKLKSLIDLAVI